MTPDNLEQTLGDAQDAVADDTLSFGDLLKEALAHKADTVLLKDGRKALKEKKPMASAEYEQLLADIKRIEIAREWLPRAAVAMFQVQHCTSCENYAPFFTGLFQRQKNRHLREADRWIAATEFENAGLKKEIKTTEVDVPFCSFCVEEFGYPIEQLGIVFDTPEDEVDAEADVDDEVEIADEADAAEQADDEQSEPTAEELEIAAWEAEQDELAESLQTGVPSND